MKQCTKCDKKVKAKGLCNSHYDQERQKTAPPCKVRECERVSMSRGLCYKHYMEDRAGVEHQYKEEVVILTKNKTCQWCGKVFFGKAVSSRRGTDMIWYQPDCWTKYNKVLKEITALVAR